MRIACTRVGQILQVFIQVFRVIAHATFNTTTPQWPWCEDYKIFLAFHAQFYFSKATFNSFREAHLRLVTITYGFMNIKSMIMSDNTGIIRKLKGDPESLLKATVNVGINKACSLQNKCI